MPPDPGDPGAPLPGAHPPDDDRIAATLLALALDRGPGRSFCPSEAARALSPAWRPLMPHVRRIAARLQATGALAATQKGQPVSIPAARGPIRLTLPG